MDYGHWDITQFGEFDPNDFFGFIYEIEEIATGRCYIGKKFFKHKRKKTKADKSKTKESDWREYTSSCEPLKEAIALQGKDKFSFRILSLCSGRCQLTYEENQLQFTRDVLRARLPNGERKYFNKTIGHLLFAGVEKQTDATKEKMRKAAMASWTMERRAAASIVQSGNQNALGTHHPGDGHIGNKNAMGGAGKPKSNSHRLKISIANRGKNSGKTRSVEHKLAKRNTMLAYWSGRAGMKRRLDLMTKNL